MVILYVINQNNLRRIKSHVTYSSQVGVGLL